MEEIKSQRILFCRSSDSSEAGEGLGYAFFISQVAPDGQRLQAVGVRGSRIAHSPCDNPKAIQTARETRHVATFLPYRLTLVVILPSAGKIIPAISHTSD